MDPAHAGMNLNLAISPVLYWGGPRACGDEPKTAEFIGNWFNKGDRILIEGEFHSESYEKDGKKISNNGVLVNNANFVDYKKKGGNEQEPMKSFGTEAGFNEEIPF